ncbi:MAG: cytochrome c1 [Persephonella sp.]|nr:MAG: cytochrome c1 [Persephonella sp.]
MKELKILAVIVVLVLIGYWGIEPLAHSIMHKHIEEAIKKYNLPDFKFSDLDPIPSGLQGNPQAGKEAVKTFCISCHSVKKEGINAPMPPQAAAQSFGVVPPDLSNIGGILDEKYLFNFLKNPQKATENPKFAMPALGLSDQQAIDIVAYLKSIAKKNMSGKEVVEEGCVRCHSIKYQKIQALSPPDTMKKYLGKVPPDLSVIYKAKGEEYLHAFINKPQAILPGTGMPRVGLDKEAQEKAIAYLEEIADPHKEQRTKVGIIVLAYLLVMVGLTYAWKRKIWKNLH